MKIAQISSIYLSIPPKSHGGTERVVFDLCQHLTKRGHQVELFASGDSKIDCSLHSVLPVASTDERLLESLDHDARKIAPYLIKRLPLSRSKTFLDVGGGLGSFALACCRRFQHLQATVVEHPRVVPFARSGRRERTHGKKSPSACPRYSDASLAEGIRFGADLQRSPWTGT